MQYTGKDNLEVLEDAVNYNSFLVSLVTKNCSLKTDKVLDFGSGTGFLSEITAEKLGITVHCVENAENLQSCYKNRKHLLLHNSLAEIKDGSMDLIYSFNVLEHIADDRATIKELARKLSSDGKIILYVPALMCLYSAMDTKVGHYRRYNKKMLEELLKSAGLTIIKSEYCDFAGFFVTLLYKFVGSKNGDLNKTALHIFDRYIFPLSRFADKLTCGKLLGKNLQVTAIKKADKK